LISNSIFIRRL